MYMNDGNSLLSEKIIARSARIGSWIFVSMNLRNLRFSLRKILRSV